ncbi:hypothetical protein A1356_21660 [Methylomonas koyamae]|uniref:Uncharacterized protein n=1 Tax=Methylomonas koyamae TaxID=702114 RepID=A0AA91DGG5_9GAMM|nr:hypothetical protein A1356_21660 [Methylomonas koyamae]
MAAVADAKALSDRQAIALRFAGWARRSEIPKTALCEMPQFSLKLCHFAHLLLARRIHSTVRDLIGGPKSGSYHQA